MSAFAWKRYLPHAAAVAAALVVVTIAMALDGLAARRDLEQWRAQVTAEAATVRARLEGIVNSTLFLTHGLTVFVATHGDIDQREFRSQAAEFVARSRHIRNIGLARDNVITHMYPLEGNEEALGLRYLEHPLQREAVLRAMRTHSTVVAGPVDLVQGGRGFIARSPIFLSREEGSARGDYWGMASIVINMDTVLHEAQVKSGGEGIRYALRGKDGLGPAGAPFFGDEALFARDPVLLDVTLPEGGSWQLAALPAGGWELAAFYRPWLRVAGAIAALLFAGLVYFALYNQQRVRRLAMCDSLTGLYNRWMFDQHLDKALARARREGGQLAVLLVDLDDFKPINDQYGHRAGDRVLRTVGERMSTVLRGADVVARIGGDEFTVLLSGVACRADVEPVARKLSAVLSAPISFEGRELRVGASVGCAIYPDDGADETTLLRHADQKMYWNKRAHKRKSDRGVA